jgi:4-hydroxy-tetrahydrodipicolinate synthase
LRLHGSITALATPFTASGEVDFAAWERLLERQLAAGSQGVVVAGSTGEAAMLTDAEFARLLRAAVAQLQSRVTILAGCGLSGTERTIEQCARARDLGAHAALVVAPPYVRPPQDGLQRHFVEVADRGGLPVVLYNVPGRTGCDLLPSTVGELVAHPSIIGIKEARGEATRIADLLALRTSTFAVLSGDDPTACDSMLAGADGVVSVASNAVPATFVELAALCAERATGEACALDGRMRPLYDLLGIDSNPIPLKALLSELALCHDVLRLPLLPLVAAKRAPLSRLAQLVAALEHDSRRRSGVDRFVQGEAP